MNFLSREPRHAAVVRRDRARTMLHLCLESDTFAITYSLTDKREHNVACTVTRVCSVSDDPPIVCELVCLASNRTFTMGFCESNLEDTVDFLCEFTLVDDALVAPKSRYGFLQFTQTDGFAWPDDEPIGPGAAVHGEEY